MSLFESLDALEALNNTPKKEEKLVVKPINKGDLTDEQYSIVHSDDQVIKVKAYAGTGKTFTLKKYAERRSDKKGLYLAFNKELQVEAERKFDKNVEAYTMHSIAYKSYGGKLAHKLTGALYPEHLNEIGIKISSNDAINLEYQKAILNSVFNFMYSGDYSVTSKNFEIEPLQVLLEMEAKLGLSEIAEQATVEKIIKDINTVWEIMSNPDDTRLPATHDVYLKQFHLNRNKLNYDFIMLDEAQDTNPVMLSIFENQKTQRILVGDSYQSIYQFREAIDGMTKGKADKEFKLTRSFRFGQKIADAANTILLLRNETAPIIGCGPSEGKIYLRENMSENELFAYKNVAIVTRSNAGMFEEAINFASKGVKVFIEGGKIEQEMRSLNNLYLLYNGQKTGDSFLNAILDLKGNAKDAFDYLQSYVQERNDQEWYLSCQMVRRYKNKLPILLEVLKDKIVSKREDAQLIVTNVHKSKGLEYDEVILSNDFKVIHLFSQKMNDAWIADKPLEKMPTLYPHKSVDDYKFLTKEQRREKQLENEELHLIYVAITRAKKMLVVPEVLAKHIEKINQHIQKDKLFENYDIMAHYELAKYPDFKNYLSQDLQQVLETLKQNRNKQLKYKL